MASKMLYRFFESSSDPVLAIDRTGGICFWNDSCHRELGLSFEEVRDRKCYEVIAGRNLHGDPYCDSDCKVFENIQSGNPSENYDLLVRDPDGRDLMVQCRCLSYSRVLPQEAGSGGISGPSPY